MDLLVNPNGKYCRFYYHHCGRRNARLGCPSRHNVSKSMTKWVSARVFLAGEIGPLAHTINDQSGRANIITGSPPGLCEDGADLGGVPRSASSGHEI